MFGRRLNFENEAGTRKARGGDVEMTDEFERPSRAIKLDLFGADQGEFPESPLKAWPSSNTPWKSKPSVSHLEDTHHSKNQTRDEDMGIFHNNEESPSDN